MADETPPTQPAPVPLDAAPPAAPPSQAPVEPLNAAPDAGWPTSRDTLQFSRGDTAGEMFTLANEPPEPKSD